MGGQELDSAGSGQEQGAGSCKHGNESSSCIKYGEFLDYLRGHYLLKKDAASWYQVDR